MSLLGYTSTVREIDIVDRNGVKMDVDSLHAAFKIVAADDTQILFDWSKHTSLDNDILTDVGAR